MLVMGSTHKNLCPVLHLYLNNLKEKTENFEVFTKDPFLFIPSAYQIPLTNLV